MKLGIYIGEFDPQAGGAYTFRGALLNEFLKKNQQHECYVFYYGKVNNLENKYTKFVRLRKNNIFTYFYIKLLSLSSKIFPFLKNNKINIINTLNWSVNLFSIDLLWFITPNYERVEVPYIYTVFDLQHRLQPYFPELIKNLVWESRETFYLNVIRKAAYVLTGTNVGKDEIMKMYNVYEKRIRVLPLPAIIHKDENNFKDQNKKISDNGYLFYPAQFWSHKNHILILKTLLILKQKYQLDLELIFTGSDKGNLKYIQAMIKKYDLDSKIKILGFVDDNKLINLYKNALALVFPSFFGPDNLPPLEAMALGCPVIAADHPGHREQLGEAALFFEVCDEFQLAERINQLITDKKLRNTLIEKGYKKAAVWTPTEYIKEIFCIIDEFSKIRRCWN